MCRAKRATRAKNFEPVESALRNVRRTDSCGPVTQIGPRWSRRLPIQLWVVYLWRWGVRIIGHIMVQNGHFMVQVTAMCAEGHLSTGRVSNGAASVMT
jgi:hypothetical protein